MKKEKKLEDSCCLKMHYKSTVGKTVWYLGEDRYTDQWNRKQTAEILTKVPRQLMGKGQTFQTVILEPIDSHMQKQRDKNTSI